MASFGEDASGDRGRSSLDSVLFRGVFFAAFATLLLEVSLVRVLSFSIWYHFAYVVISTALLGFGASGTLVAVWPRLGTVDLRASLARCAIFSALAVAGALAFFAWVPLHPMSLLDEPREAVVFLAYQLVATVPFFFGGLVISLALREAATRVDRLYFWDLAGAGLGCAIAVALMNRLSPPGAVAVAGAAFAVAAILFARTPLTRIGSGLLAAIMLVGASRAPDLPFTVARSKQLAQQTSAGMVPRMTRWTALFRTDVLENVVGRWQERCGEWGVSSRAPGCNPPHMYVSHDATASTGIYDLRKSTAVPHFEYQVLRMPHLVTNPQPRVLVIGVGGGRDVIVARQFGASHVTGVELDPVTVELIRDHLDALEAGFFRDSQVRLVAGEGRHFTRSSADRFDLIQITGVDTLAAEFSGAYVLAENYVYTVEAMLEYMDHLRPGGVLSFATGNIQVNEPRAAGRMVSNARRALRARGIERPEEHIAVIDSRHLFVEIMIRPEPFEPAQVERLAEHAAKMGFRVLHLPGRSGHPIYSALASERGEGRQRLLDSLPYRIEAVTDDRPFFFSFFRWTGLVEPGTVTPTHTSALGQIVLVLLLVTLSLLGAALVLLPLLVFRRRGIARAGKTSRGVIGILVYFLCVGLGFMLFEISLIQRFVLFLGYPTYSLSVTLFSLLVFVGFGSLLSRRWVGREHVVLPLAVLTLAGLAVSYAKGLPPLQDAFLGESLAVRVAVTLALLVPLGLVLGTFFPLGIRRAVELHPDLVPWAWGINGCASVTAGLLAVVLAMSLGFTRVWVLSVSVYALGVGAFWVAGRSRGRETV